MIPKSKYLTSFSTPLGFMSLTICYLVNVPGTFVMTRMLLCEIRNVATFIVDMCIYSETLPDCILTMSNVYQII